MKIPTYREVDKKRLKLPSNLPNRKGRDISYLLTPLERFIYNFSPVHTGEWGKEDEKKLRRFRKELQDLVNYVEREVPYGPDGLSERFK